MERSRKIVVTSIQGIIVNLLLVAFKLFVGFLSNSIAIILDAVNNLSDALSSVLTIIGMKIAGKTPDKKHPFGYGRMEYISSVSIAVLVLFAGITSMKESIVKVYSGEAASYSVVSLIIIAVAVVVKFLFGGYVKRIGNQFNAQSLVASGTDARMDSLLSLGTLIAALISFFFNYNLEGIFGAIISVFILKAGLDILKDTMDHINGTRVDSEFAGKIKDMVNSYSEVQGSYDLVLNDYGPNEMVGSIHIEIEDDMPAREIHTLSRKIRESAYKEFGVLLAIGIYATNSNDTISSRIKSSVYHVTKVYPEVLQIHGFYVDISNKSVSFDLVIDFTAENVDKIRNDISNTLEIEYPEYHFIVLLDKDYSD